ncbi:MAG: PspC domain-containing protein [DPANN group archaeon]|nr:PspC domain-containing protein [DPANN group archaeon]
MAARKRDAKGRTGKAGRRGAPGSRGSGPALKRLYRSRTDRVFAGICGGFGEYFDVDPVWFRIAFILLFFNGPGLILYIFLWLIVPEYPGKDIAKADLSMKGARQGCSGNLLLGIVLLLLGILFSFDTIFGWFSFLHVLRFWPFLLVLLGMFLIVRGRRQP